MKRENSESYKSWNARQIGCCSQVNRGTVKYYPFETHKYTQTNIKMKRGRRKKENFLFFLLRAMIMMLFGFIFLVEGNETLKVLFWDSIKCKCEIKTYFCKRCT